MDKSKLQDMEKWARDEYENIENGDALTVLSILIDLISLLADSEKEKSS